jgi:hypothetical protein
LNLGLRGHPEAYCDFSFVPPGKCYDDTSKNTMAAFENLYKLIIGDVTT